MDHAGANVVVDITMGWDASRCHVGPPATPPEVAFQTKEGINLHQFLKLGDIIPVLLLRDVTWSRARDEGGKMDLFPKS